VALDLEGYGRSPQAQGRHLGPDRDPHSGHAAALDRRPADGVGRTRERITGALADRFARDVVAEATSVGGAPGVRVTVRAGVPPLGLWGPAVPLEVEGHAIAEVLP